LTGSLHSRSAHGESSVKHGSVTKLAGTFAKGFGLQKVASVRSMSSSETTTTSGVEPGVAAECMQFTLGEKGFCMVKSKNGGIYILPLIAGKCWHDDRDHTHVVNNQPQPRPPAALQHLTAMVFP